MIFEQITKLFPPDHLESILESFAQDRPVQIAGLQGSSRSFFFTLLQQHLRMPLVLITATTRQAEQYHSDLTYLQQCYSSDRGGMLYFPAHDTEPYQGVSPHPQISVLRMQALWHLSQSNARILVVPIEAATQWIAPPESFSRGIFSVTINEERSPN